MSIIWLTPRDARAAASHAGPMALPHVEDDGPAPEDIHLDQVTPSGWRVTDGRLPVGDPFRLMAFVEFREHSFDVMVAGRGFEWSTFSTFDDAIAHVVGTSTALAHQRVGGRRAGMA